MGNYEQTDIDVNLSTDSIKLTDYNNFNYESKIYLVYLYNENQTLDGAEANAIISDLNNKSSLRSFIIPQKDILRSNVSV